MDNTQRIPRVIDLFSGVGGLSLGAARAGFHVAAAIELDSRAMAAHRINFPGSVHLEHDVSELAAQPSKLLDATKLRREEIAGIIGGPPCQGFSAIGRKNAADPRNSLFVSFFEIVAKVMPAFYVAENVPGIMDSRNENVRSRALDLIPKNYVALKPFTIKASEHGAPTTRKRVFFIGYDPSRVSKLRIEDFLPPKDAKVVCVEDAFEGLPSLGATWPLEDSWKKVEVRSKTPFAKKAVSAVPNGVGDSETLRLHRENGLVSGFLPTFHTAETVKRFEAVECGKRDSVSKSVRLERKGLCPTLRAGTGPERGSYQAVRPIHPDSPRVISPREAARLQGFPDWFRFDDTKWHAFRQIGNSVSPIVAEAVLRTVYTALMERVGFDYVAASSLATSLPEAATE